MPNRKERRKGKRKPPAAPDFITRELAALMMESLEPCPCNKPGGVCQRKKKWWERYRHVKHLLERRDWQAL